MEEKTNPNILEMLGKRFAQIRNKVGLTQKQVGDQLGLSQKKISLIESGNGGPAEQFMSVFCFYAQFISADKLIHKGFDIEDPHLFETKTASSDVAKAMVQMLKADLMSELEDKKKDIDRRLSSIELYL